MSSISRDPVGAQRRDHHRGARADVERAHRRRRQPRHPADHRVMALRADVGAHTPQLVDVEEPASNTFSVTMLVPSAMASIAIRIGWKSVARPGYGRVTKSIERARPAWRTRSPSSPNVDVGAGVGELRQEQLQVRRPGVRDRHVAQRGDRAAAQVPASIRSGIDGVLGRAQSPYTPVISDRARPGPLDVGPHRAKELRQVGDLRLARGVVEHRGPAGQHGGQHEVLGAP